jgi:peroxiredoxin (alkyl hydroperoxide reductase subunit C)
MILLGKKAPYFKAKAVVNGNEIVKDFSLEQYIGKKYVVFFFYPLDFSGTCPTEIIALQNRMAEFEERNCQLVGCSVDSHYSHRAWLHTEQSKGGILGVKYPLVSDLSKTISLNYDVLAGHYSMNDAGEQIFIGSAQAYRGLFIIDKKGIVRHQSMNEMGIARSVDEIIRNLDTVQHVDETGNDCLADWKKK